MVRCFYARRKPLESILSTSDLLLQILFSLDDDYRIVGTREPDPSPGPMFFLIRGKEDHAWAVRSNVPLDVAKELDALAREEPPIADFRDDPVNAKRYRSLIEGRVDSGPAFEFPKEIATATGTVFVEDRDQLEYHFTGWTKDEIPHRTPIVAVIDDGHAVSVCFCARRTDVAAEAGVETAVEYRGQGLAPRVTAAWASAIRASGRVPLYSTSWTNHASLAVARKLDLVVYASIWSIS